MSGPGSTSCPAFLLAIRNNRPRFLDNGPEKVPSLHAGNRQSLTIGAMVRRNLPRSAALRQPHLWTGRSRIGARLPALALAFAATAGVLHVTDRPAIAPSALADEPAKARGGETVNARFGLCSDGNGDTCVVDGDTLRYAGRRIRVIGIDTPELHPSRCAREEELGRTAKLRMQALVNMGPFRLEPVGARQDVYGRDLRRLVRGGTDIGLQLVAEGLARPYGSGRQSWC